jgi:hypothetical protein
MYDEPELIHDLMDMITEAFILWVQKQKQHAGEPLDASNGLQGVWSPKGVGVWISDDDLVSVGPDLYAEFVVPCYRKLFATFSGGSLHYCGNGTQQLENFSEIGNIRAINNSPMGNTTAFNALVTGRPHGAVIQIQDNAPEDPDTYYRRLFANTKDFTSIMVATWILDTVAMMSNGGYKTIQWDSLDAANNTVKAIRNAVIERMEAIG